MASAALAQAGSISQVITPPDAKKLGFTTFQRYTFHGSAANLTDEKIKQVLAALVRSQAAQGRFFKMMKSFGPNGCSQLDPNNPVDAQLLAIGKAKEAVQKEFEAVCKQVGITVTSQRVR